MADRLVPSMVVHILEVSLIQRGVIRGSIVSHLYTYTNNSHVGKQLGDIHEEANHADRISFLSINTVRIIISLRFVYSTIANDYPRIILIFEVYYPKLTPMV